MATAKELEDAAAKSARDTMARQIQIDEAADKLVAEQGLGRRKALHLAAENLSADPTPKKADKA